MKEIIMISMLIILVFTFGCAEKEITNFEECIAAGNPVKESYPRQCSDGENTFTEVLNNLPRLTLNQVREIAGDSECTSVGELTAKVMFNDITKTWWIDLDTDKLGCNPACVVSENTMRAEVNWRCTGLIPE